MSAKGSLRSPTALAVRSRDSLLWRASSAATLSFTSLLAKSFWYGAFRSKATGVEEFRRILENKSRDRGIVTVANHISVLDDPVAWSCLPLRNSLKPSLCRWTLGAQDICFTNSFFSLYFSLGQVIPTSRGQGIYQRAIDVAVEKLDSKAWIHMFPEGYVNQRTMGRVGPLSGTKETPEGTRLLPSELLRFRWGVGRILMETKTLPHIVPMWIDGFHEVMPDDRTTPRWLPKTGKSVNVTFGNSIDLEKEIGPLIARWKKQRKAQQADEHMSGEAVALEEKTRIEVARLLREGVARTGQMAIDARACKST